MFLADVRRKALRLYAPFSLLCALCSMLYAILMLARMPKSPGSSFGSV